jgi:uncharacterized protein (AIM24 family)
MDASVESGADGALVVELEADESVLAATDSLVDHSGGVRVERAREGVLRSVANAASERAPIRVHAAADATVRLAPAFRGELVACDVSEEPVAATRSAFLAATDDVRIGADRVGDAPARGDGLFLTTLAGEGAVYLAGRGRVDAVTVEVDEEHVVSADHVVAFERRAEVTVERSPGVEDVAPTCRIVGPARVWVGTRRESGRSHR